VLRLQQLRYATRFPLDTNVAVKYRNPGATEAQTATLQTVEERASFSFSSFNVGRSGVELPVEYQLLDSGLMYVKIYSFFDNSRLSIELWERMMQTLNENEIPGLIIDMRQNGGGSGFLADQMAAYFYDEPLELGNTGRYDEERDEFYFDPRGIDRFYLPPENLRFAGPVAVLVGPNCNSACEFFTHDMTLQDRAAIVGQYPTAGLGGGQKAFLMPGGIQLQFSIGRPVDAEGNIIIEGTGVAPTVKVPVNEETLFSEGDPILEAAIQYLSDQQ
jgi:C-terminal processing protease CtpA/Prc